jgi:tetratricopeptide (TPR) repeat protein
MFTEGNSERALFALNRGLVLSRQLSEPLFELQVLSSLQIFYQRSGNYFRSMEFSQQSFVVAEKLGDPAALAAAHSMLGLSNHLLGNHPAARTHLDSALANTAVSKRVTTQFFGFDYQNRLN